ncbi:MAG: hypothetical protein NW224_10795 [Leptolyngbyaceae cyanobacterium bins.302]|nr:hypothetical protein [Leptolyngbyaceae cyanobacterium bins.302]
MFKLLLLMACTTAITACAYLSVHSFSSPSFSQSAMTSSPITVKRTSLIAREKTIPPIGANTKQNYPTKSATVFVELENLQQTDVKVTVQKIEVRNQTSDRLELVNQQPQEITLRPLQSSIRDFHLNKPGTFEKPGEVKAIVTLQINGETRMVESKAIAIQPY